MRYILSCIAICALASASALAYTSPGAPTGFVNDVARVLSAEEKTSLETQSAALRNATGFEVVTVIVPTIGDETIETYAVKLFQEWGIGDKEKDTGLLILVALNEKSVRIETGYGTEGIVTDIQSGTIIRTIIVPAFQKGDYYTGVQGALNALSQIIQGSPEAAQYSNNTKQSASSDIDIGLIFFVCIIIIQVLARILGKTKSWWLGGVIGATIGVIIGLICGFIYIGIIAIIIGAIAGLIFDFLVSKGGGFGHGSHGGWIFPMGGGRGFGGGFGGFGGGMSGGGGASGRW